MISVVIPCYNAARFIEETIHSIKAQGEEAIEVIVVDDGSTDGTAEILQSINLPGLTYVYQENSGVSVARNKGLSYARGEYVIFFDADDKMSEGFLYSRRKILDEERTLGFCCGPVLNFPGASNKTYGIAEDVAHGLLTYKPEYSSCPSNYLIRRSVLVSHHLFFNEALSSTADRFFLIQLSTKTSGKLIHDAPLLYRITPGSMSNKLTQRLVADNETYFQELQKHGLIPDYVRNEFLFRINYILGLGFIRTGLIAKGMKYTVTAFIKSPVKFINQIF